MRQYKATANWTYGAEHEWADWPLSTQLPEGYGRDVKDYTIVNSNGIANDPRGETCDIGGEINTPPTDSIVGQVECLNSLRRLLPMATVNYRSNLHIHIRVPGLQEDLPALKQLQRYIHDNMRQALDIIQPLPKPVLGQVPPTPEPGAIHRRDMTDAYGPEYFLDEEWYEGAVRRWKRRRVSHQTLLTPERVAGQLEADTIDEFFKREVPRAKKDGRPLWHCQPRVCVNVRQLLETDTIEFRHFAGTMDPNIMHSCLTWCRDFLHAALNDIPIDQVLELYKTSMFPHWPEYNHGLEIGYRATCHDHSIKHAQIVRNVERIKRGQLPE